MKKGVLIQHYWLDLAVLLVSINKKDGENDCKAFIFRQKD